MKKFFFDCETSGLDNKKHGILSIGYLIEIHGEVREEGCLYMRPPEEIVIDSKALQVNGISLGDIITYPTEIEQMHKLYNSLCTYGSGRFDMVGYNVEFDKGFLSESFKRARLPELNQIFNYKPMDIYALIRGLDYLCNWNLPNHKLSTVARYFTIPLIAHDALEDIKATRKILENLKGKVHYGQV